MLSPRLTSTFFATLFFACFAALPAPLCAQAKAPAESAPDTATSAAIARGEVVVRSYFMDEAKRDIDYALYVPTTYDEGKPAPLVVLLHGLGSNPKQVIGYRGIVDEAEDRGYVVVAPYGFNERGWYGSRGKGKEGPFFGTAKDPDNLGELSEKDVFSVIAIVEKDLRIDEKRRFLMGHSMGGAGTVYLGATRQGMWAGLAPLAPALGGSMDLLQQLGTTPVYVVMGEKDRMVPVRTVRKWVEEMKRLEVPVTYEEIPDGDHARVIAQNEAMIGRVFDFFDAAGKKAKTDDAKEPQQKDRDARDAKPGDDSKGGEAPNDDKK